MSLMTAGNKKTCEGLPMQDIENYDWPLYLIIHVILDKLLLFLDLTVIFLIRENYEYSLSHKL